MSRVDNLGRVVIPIEFRRALNFKSGSDIDITMTQNSVVIRLREKMCKLCGNEISNNTSMGLCDNCITTIKKL